MSKEQAIKARVQAVAREKGIFFNACWKQLLLERFLARLAASAYTHRFIFKGGFLLAYLIEIGRETTDLDFLLTRMKVEEKQLEEAFNKILSVHSADGFVFSFDSIQLLDQPHMDYLGYRVVLNATYGKMRDKIQIDVGVGDVVEPLSHEITLAQYRGNPFFENSISLQIYPFEAIFSEKLETILSKGAKNSRMKDYHDLILLIRAENVLNLGKLNIAAANTFSHRGTAFSLIQFDNVALEGIQILWAAHLRDLRDKDLGLPESISEGIEEINRYIAQLNPMNEASDTLFGKMKGTIHIVGDITAPIDEIWNASL